MVLLIDARRLSEGGDTRGAEQSARRALALRPDAPMAIAMLALLLSSMAEKLDEAAELAMRATAISPDERQLHNLVTTIALKARRFEDARDSAARILERWPNERRALHDSALAANALARNSLLCMLPLPLKK